MKKRYLTLAVSLVLSGALVAGAGGYIKHKLIKPLQLPEYEQKSVFELPFLVYSDEFLRFMLENAEELLATQPPASQMPTNQRPSLGPIEPSSSATLPPQTLIPTTGLTQPSAGTTWSTQLPIPTIPTQPPITQTPTTQIPMTQPPKPDPNQPNFNFPGTPVADSWFDNTLFVGNSRICGLRGNARSGKADYFCDYGMTVFNYRDKVLSDKNFQNKTLEQVLSGKKYDKIFINFGLNEAGYPLNSFKLAYQKLFDQIRDAQPDAVIIIHCIMGVTRGKASEGAFFEPDNLAKMNDYLSSLQNGSNVFFIDVNPYFMDSQGYMFESLTNDGYHLTAAGCYKWRDWIAHAVSFLGI